MNDEFDNETVHITGDPSESLHFFQKILDDASILGLIPKGATIEIVSNHPDDQGARRTAAAAKRAIKSIEIGDLTVYVLKVPAHADATG